MQRLSCHLLVALLVGGCAHYAPPKVDAKTGLYPTGTQLDKGAVLQRRSDVNLSKYRFAYLKAQTNVYPARFEFFLREAFARMGIKHVLNGEEIRRLSGALEDESEEVGGGKSSPLARLAEHFGPFLAIGVSSEAGNTRRLVRAKIVDATTGEVLLEIVHDKYIWIEPDAEAHYPVINEIKRWVDASARI